MDAPETNSASEAVPPLDPSGAGVRSLLLKAGGLLILAIIVALLCHYTALRQWLEPAGVAVDWVRRTGAWGAAIFVVASTVLMMLGLPRLLLCPPAGVLFGFWGGMAVSLVSTLAAYQAVFMFVRGRHRNHAPTPALPKKLAWLARDPGWMGVLVARLLPVHGMAITLALSLSKVRNSAYLLGSLVGLAPEAAPLVLLGASLNPDGEPHMVSSIIATGLLAGVAGIGIFWGIRRARRKRGSGPG